MKRGSVLLADKGIVVAMLIAWAIQACVAQDASDPATFGAGLRYSEALEFVTEGGFDYAALRASVDKPVAILEDSHTPAPPEDPNRAKAYWIDAYNRNVISSVLRAEISSSVMDTEYPFFDKKLYLHFGQKLSLNDIEKRMLFGRFPDARIHFALVCAANSCPPLYPKPFSEVDDLDRLLDSLTRRSINDTLFVKFDDATGVVLLSRLFDWYEADYRRDTGSVVAFISNYHARGKKILEREWSKKFREYDWSLNQRPKRSK